MVTCCNTFINLLPLSLLLGLFLLRFFDEVMGKYRIAKEKLDKFGDKTPAGGRLPVSEVKVDKKKDAVLEICGSNAGFCTALQHSMNRRNVFRVGTGSMELNKLLGGGLESMAITEVFGEFRTGKSQLSHTLCVTTQMPGENGFSGGKVIYLGRREFILELRLIVYF